MPAFYYSSTAGSYTLTGDVNPSATILVLNTVTGLPSSVPFKVVVDAGQPSEEIVKVTAVAGTSLTVVRGWDGTGATSHAAGAAIRHMLTAEDLTLSRAHEDSSVAHGASGAVVGTTNAQTLSNKNLANGTNTFPASFATLSGAEVFSNKTILTPLLRQAVLKGTPDDTGSLFTAKKNDDTVLLKLEPGALNIGDAIKAYTAPGVADSNHLLDLVSPGITTVPLYVKAAVGQTGSLIEARSADGATLLFKVASNGAITSNSITALEMATSDSGWVNVAIQSGKAGQAGQPPQVRRIGSRVYVRWGWDNTGLTANNEIIAGTVPSGYRPPRTCYLNMVGSTGNQYGMAVVAPTGVISIRTAQNLADYYLFSGELSGWFLD